MERCRGVWEREEGDRGEDKGEEEDREEDEGDIGRSIADR